MEPRFFLTEKQIIKSFYGYVNEDSSNAKRRPEIQTDTVEAFFKALNDFASSGKSLKRIPQNIPYSKEVELIQAGLNYLGYPLPKFGVDGLFGPETEAAVKSFQTTHSLNPSGAVDSETVKTLIDDLKGKNFDQNKLRDYLGDQVNYIKGDSLLKDPSFLTRLSEVSQSLGVNPEDLARVMKAESGLNPKATNPYSGACGLIGFMPSTASNLGTSAFELKKMTAVQQLDYVEKYYKPYAGRLRSLEDIYSVTFYPPLLGKDMSYVIGSERGEKYARLIASQNPGIAKGKEFATKQDFFDYLSKVRSLSLPISQFPGPRLS